MMNTRLQNRMTESEILKIFADTVEVGSLTLSTFHRRTNSPLFSDRLLRICIINHHL